MTSPPWLEPWVQFDKTIKSWVNVDSWTALMSTLSQANTFTLHPMATNWVTQWRKPNDLGRSKQKVHVESLVVPLVSSMTHRGVNLYIFQWALGPPILISPHPQWCAQSPPIFMGTSWLAPPFWFLAFVPWQGSSFWAIEPYSHMISPEKGQGHSFAPKKGQQKSLSVTMF